MATTGSSRTRSTGSRRRRRAARGSIRNIPTSTWTWPSSTSPSPSTGSRNSTSRVRGGRRPRRPCSTRASATPSSRRASSWSAPDSKRRPPLLRPNSCPSFLPLPASFLPLQPPTSSPSGICHPSTRARANIGHSDHANEYCALSVNEKKLPALWMCYAGGAGFGGYGGYGGFLRMIRIFEFDMNEARITTWKRVEYGDEKERKIDTQILVDAGHPSPPPPEE